MHLHSLRIGQGEVKGIPKHVAQASPFNEERAPTAPPPCLPGGPRSSDHAGPCLRSRRRKANAGLPGTGWEGVPQWGESRRRAKSFLSYISLPHIRLANWVFFHPFALLHSLAARFAHQNISTRSSVTIRRGVFPLQRQDRPSVFIAFACFLQPLLCSREHPAHWFSFGAQLILSDFLSQLQLS
jgi:hypothetical protein